MSKHRRHRRRESERRVHSSNAPVNNIMGSLLNNINRDDVIALLSRVLFNQNGNSKSSTSNNINRSETDKKAETERNLEMLNSLRPLVGEQNGEVLDKIIDIYSGNTKTEEKEDVIAPE